MAERKIIVIDTKNRKQLQVVGVATFSPKRPLSDDFLDHALGHASQVTRDLDDRFIVEVWAGYVGLPPATIGAMHRGVFMPTPAAV